MLTNKFIREELLKSGIEKIGNSRTFFTLPNGKILCLIQRSGGTISNRNGGDIMVDFYKYNPSDIWVKSKKGYINYTWEPRRNPYCDIVPNYFMLVFSPKNKNLRSAFITFPALDGFIVNGNVAQYLVFSRKVSVVTTLRHDRESIEGMYNLFFSNQEYVTDTLEDSISLLLKSNS